VDQYSRSYVTPACVHHSLPTIGYYLAVAGSTELFSEAS
jgi:hypothetical protein